MKNKFSLFSLLFCFCLSGFFACKNNNGFNDIVSKDGTKPGVVMEASVVNYNGGSYISYSLPNTANTLYVQANYQIRDGVSRETKASYYSATVNVEGFAKSQEYEVTLYTVSRAGIASDPVSVKVHPNTPVFESVRASVAVSPDFGGVNIAARNPDKKEIGVILTAFDKSTNAMEVQDQHYTNAEVINYSIRGFSAEARDFAVYTTDKFGNVSEDLKINVTPYFEELLDKSKFSEYRLTTDSPSGYGWVVPNLWDGRTDDSSQGWHTDPSGPPAPFVCTFNIGITYKLSRFVLWERPGGYTYNHGNPRVFSLWGSNESSPRDTQLPLKAAEGAVVGDWVNLGNYNYPDPPSGKPVGSTTAADEAFVKAGVNFDISLNAPPVHFIRLAVARTWTAGSFAHAMEISLYGKKQ